MNRIVHFEIHALEPEKLGEFYTKVFGWEIQEWPMPGANPAPENRYFGVMTAPKDSKEPGINGGIVVRRTGLPKGGEPVTSFVCTVSVENVDEYIKKIESFGGKNVVPKMPIMGLAWLAYCTDPENNIFGIYQDDKNAK